MFPFSSFSMPTSPRDFKISFWLIPLRPLPLRYPLDFLYALKSSWRLSSVIDVYLPPDNLEAILPSFSSRFCSARRLSFSSFLAARFSLAPIKSYLFE